MRISWFTNVAAPYRVPIWEHIEQNHELSVHLLETRESLLREGRRPADWSATGSDRYTWVPNFTIRRGERSYYLSRRLSLLSSGVDAVLLGAWESPFYFQLLLEAKARSVRTVGFYESTLLSNRYKRGPIAAARSAFFRTVDAVVVPGAAAEEAVLSFGVDAGRVFRGFNAVDVSKFHTAAVGRQSTPPTNGGHRFVFVGQLIERKNPRILLEAFAAIARPADSLSFFGEGEELVPLRELAVALNVESRVKFEGNRTNDELARALPGFNTLVLPSAEEVWGLVVNEALAAGLGAVVSASAGVARSVAGMKGVVIANPTQGEIADAMIEARATGADVVRDPEILKHTPQSFAEVFLRALETKPSTC